MKDKMIQFLKRQPPGRIIAGGFAVAILLGSLLLMLPCCVKDNVELQYIDALYTAASAVCVTGLLTVDIADTYTGLGQFIVGVLMQFGGLGVAAVGAGIMLAMGRKINLKGRGLIREGMNVGSAHGLILLVKEIFTVTIIFEGLGAICSFFVFIKDYPLLRAIGISIFHAVAAFNNSGMDILGGGQSLTAYYNDIMLNLITCILVIAGGLGFLVIKELQSKKFHWRRLSMHTRTVVSTTLSLLVMGTILFKMTEDISWMGAFFNSVTARTAGFATYFPFRLSMAGQMVMIVLMVIGASPGSTGGGIKTTTFFVLLQGIKSAATNTIEKAFGYSIPIDEFRKSAVIILLAISVILGGTWLLLVMHPELALNDALFETASAFGTAGLSTGITAGLCTGAKLLFIFIMYIGRLGPLTVASLWYFNAGERVRYPEGDIAIG